MSQVAFVTGGARRIGRAVAQRLHSRGVDIALHYRSSAADAEQLAGEFNAARPDSCATFQADLESLDSVRALTTAVAARFGTLTLLVNNASGFAATPIGECTAAEFDAMVGSNLRGPYFLIQGLLPAIAPGGSIVNILDVHIERPLPHYNAYGAAKAGLASLTRSLAVELGPDVRVNGVAPGAILWPEEGGAYDAATRERTLGATPLRRLGEPADIARTVAFLAFDAPFITGQIITVDGGRSLTG
ncbi:MAG: pteridine reductase [Halioglobus sp.]